jgi:hypothetical protein
MFVCALMAVRRTWSSKFSTCAAPNCQGEILLNSDVRYSQTIPYFRCQAEVRLCSDACTGNSKCQSDCVQNRPCGATNPPRLNSSATTSTQTATKTGGSTTDLSGTDSGSGFAATGSSDPQTTGANSGAGSLLLELGNAYGMGLFAIGIAVGAAMIGA